MSSTGYPSANSRWRPTLPEVRRPSAATRGLGRAGGVYLVIGSLVVVPSLALAVLGRFVAPACGVKVFAAVFLALAALVAVAAVVTWWLTWGAVTAEGYGRSR